MLHPWIMPHIWTDCAAHMSLHCRTYKRGLGMSDVTHVDESHYNELDRVMYAWTVSLIWAYIAEHGCKASCRQIDGSQLPDKGHGHHISQVKHHHSCDHGPSIAKYLAQFLLYRTCAREKANIGDRALSTARKERVHAHMHTTHTHADSLTHTHTHTLTHTHTHMAPFPTRLPTNRFVSTT